MKQSTVRYSCMVQADWVDYNGHMNDAAYAQVFSLAVDSWMNEIGLDAEGRAKHSYTIFTLETHLCYLKEANEHEELDIYMQLLDDDEKRLHVFFEMKNQSDDLLATSEQMLMGINTVENKPAPLPENIANKVAEVRQQQVHFDMPVQAGRKIGIKRKNDVRT